MVPTTTPQTAQGETVLQTPRSWSSGGSVGAVCARRDVESDLHTEVGVETLRTQTSAYEETQIK